MTPREIAERINAYARECLICFKPEYSVIDMGEHLIQAHVLELEAEKEDLVKALKEMARREREYPKLEKIASDLVDAIDQDEVDYIWKIAQRARRLLQRCAQVESK